MRGIFRGVITAFICRHTIEILSIFAKGGMTMKKGIIAAALLMAVLCLAACAPGANELRGTAPGGGTPAGFWKGLWHGMIAPVTFIVSLFNRAVNVYEVRNSGNWYNFGFMLGLTMSVGGGGSGAAAARRRRRSSGE
jgi:hypothetical protein